jgi:two-component system sensor histidine kinase PhoQ
VEDNSTAWQSVSALGVTLPDVSLAQPGEAHFQTPGETGGYYIYSYGIGWEMGLDHIRPFTVSVIHGEDEVQAPLAAFRAGLWRWLLGVAAILVLAQGVLLMFAFRPLRRIAEDVARIESGGAPRLEGEYTREIEPLARNVNRLLDNEQANQQRIRHALDSLAHSLKTPLAIVQAALPSVPTESAQTIEAAVDDMNRLIATRLERAGASTRRTLAAPVPVEPQAERVLNSLGKVHSHRMIRSELKLEPGLKFYGEQRDLLEIMGNLLDNAFKYGANSVRLSGGEIDSDSSRPGLWLRVEDDGPGIAAKLHSRLLERGQRGDERIEGHGLGLAIVLELATAYGGTVEIDDSSLGGAAVTVRVPGT